MRILFVVNPISGSGKGKKAAKTIHSLPEYASVDYDITVTEYAGHAREIVAKAIASGKYTHIVAVGGDGTVNEVGSAMVGSDLTFGIVSIGSGNGFARHLGYSTQMKKAFRQVLCPSTAQADVLDINGVCSLNVSGVGFDAAVAHEFARHKTRGLLSYVRAGIKMWFRHRPQHYRITCDGATAEGDWFILSFANSSQYGNNALIAPHASIRDGQMNICTLKKPSWWKALPFLLAMVRGRVDTLDIYHEIRCSEATVEGDIHAVHIDGEPSFLDSPLHLSMRKGVLKLVVPKLYRK